MSGPKPANLLCFKTNAANYALLLKNTLWFVPLPPLYHTCAELDYKNNKK